MFTFVQNSSAIPLELPSHGKCTKYDQLSQMTSYNNFKSDVLLSNISINFVQQEVPHIIKQSDIYW